MARYLVLTEGNEWLSTGSTKEEALKGAADRNYNEYDLILFKADSGETYQPDGTPYTY